MSGPAKKVTKNVGFWRHNPSMLDLEAFVINDDTFRKFALVLIILHREVSFIAPVTICCKARPMLSTLPGVFAVGRIFSKA